MSIYFNPTYSHYLGARYSSTARFAQQGQTSNQGEPLRARLTFYDLFDGYVYGNDAKTLYNALHNYNSKKSQAFKTAISNATALFRVEVPQGNGLNKSEYMTALNVVKGIMDGRIPMKELERVVEVCLRSADPTALRNLNVTKAKIATRYTANGDPHRDILQRIGQLPL